MGAFDQIRARIFRKRHAYRAVFAPDGVPSPGGQIVLADLRRFCRASRSTSQVSLVTGCIDPLASAQAEGRREVFLRICNMLHMDDAKVYRLTDDGDTE